jgi:DNA-binding NarL/FixJ family response regulator
MNTILIVEDQKILLDGLEISLSKEFKVVGKITNSRDIIPFLKINKDVDLILADICTEDTNSLDTIREVKSLCPKISVVVMTGIPEVSFVAKAKAVGADSFIYKNVSFEEMSSVIKSTLSGYSIYPDTRSPEAAECLKYLNDRELEILRLYCAGLNKKEISKRMSYSESSIKQYVRSMLDKTGFESLSQLAIFVISYGFVVPQKNTAK